MKIKENDLYFTKLCSDAVIPTKRGEDAGYDIYPCFNDDLLLIRPGETVLVPTGIASAFHCSKYIQIEEKSSVSSKGIKKSCGVIDSGYRGEWLIALTNTSNLNFLISKYTEAELLEQTKLNEHGDRVILTKENKEFPLYWYLEGEYIENFMLHPYNKAIVQAVVHELPEMDVKEVSYEQLKEFTSERMTGGFGSTNK